MKIHELTAYLEEFAPPAYQESYDNSGLIAGEPDEEVTGILLCLDCIEAVVEEAIRTNCNFILAHHPILFSGIKRLTGNDYVQRTIMKAIRNNIAIYAAHTNADNVAGGVNAIIADKMGLEDRAILAPKTGLLRKLVTFIPEKHVSELADRIYEAGAGVIGNYDSCSFRVSGKGTFRGNENSDPFVGEKNQLHEEQEQRFETIFPRHLTGRVVNALQKHHPYEEVAYDIYPLENEHPGVGSGLIGSLEKAVDASEFLNQLKSIFQAPMIRHTELHKKKVQRIAVCGGSGSFLLPKAIQVKADVFVTADFKYHQFFDAEGKIIIADIGHYESEQFTAELFYSLLTKKFPTFAIRFSEISTNPVNYL